MSLPLTRKQNRNKEKIDLPHTERVVQKLGGSTESRGIPDRLENYPGVDMRVGAPQMQGRP